MFELLNKALIAQAVLMQIMAAMAYVEYKLALNPGKPSIALKYLIHVIFQAFITFLALIAATYTDPSWDFELKSSWPWIFGVAGVSVLTMYVEKKLGKEVKHETA